MGTGPNSIIGITQLMEARIDYLNSLSDFQYAAPEISNVAYSPGQVTPYSEVWFTAEVANATNVYIGHRSTEYGLFDKALMYDDGNHHDGQAGDGLYGVSLMAGSTDLRYYIYAENQDAAAFAPSRAEYEYFSIPVAVELVLNEFMADNTNTMKDQDGEYDDWIELFNNGTGDVALGGYQLSDDAAMPGKWTFPDTAIAAGGYLVVWADDDGNQQGLHANFKLSASGELIILSNSGGTLLDEIPFGQQKSDTSTGRYPNGTGEFTGMLPTFGAENIAGFTGIGEDPALQGSSFTLSQNYPNPYTDVTAIDFTLDREEEVTLKVFNIYGTTIQTLVSGSLTAGRYSYKWNAGNLPPGIYFYAITVGDQTQVKKMAAQ